MILPVEISTMIGMIDMFRGRADELPIWDVNPEGAAELQDRAGFRGWFDLQDPSPSEKSQLASKRREGTVLLPFIASYAVHLRNSCCEEARKGT